MQFTINREVPFVGLPDRCHTLMHVHTGTTKKPKTRRPEEEVKAAAFLRAAPYLEDDDDEQITVGAL